ncbi:MULTISPECIES: LysR family transcriptional regulator [Acinetobacter]|uniref:LysR family transcriptional regulator n=1 Tax=Acinetobacter TaxID=469 RepID=UPI00029C9BEA|nr:MULTISPECIES: LysR family transcriptional regulator [Acinetobacter]EKU40245.1 transcriptional regulator, LysR family [Acinetobacter sp. WC-141]MBM7139101.1 LysR family transcriptional regulator [Acinetobacter sp. 105-3]
MQVSLQALKAFESAARLGSFKLAAEELSLTPTAISHHIANLESRLNVDLFHRQVRKITLTTTGDRLAVAISEGFRKIENALDEITINGNTLRVATTSSLAAMLLIPSINEFYQLHPEISVEFSTGEALESHLYTLPIRYGEVSSVPSKDVLKYESFNVFGSSKLDLSKYTSGPIALFTTEWKNKALPSPPLENWLEENGWDQTKITIKKFDQEIFGIHEALAANGLVFCSSTLAQRFIKANLIQQLKTKAVQSELCYYIPNKEDFRNRNARKFVEWIEKIFNQ